VETASSAAVDSDSTLPRARKSAQTTRISQLERAGLVARLPDPPDQRGVLVERVVEAHAETDRRLVGILADEEKECLSNALSKLLLWLERVDGETAEGNPSPQQPQTGQ
jgi:hypothetical protein